MGPRLFVGWIRNTKQLQEAHFLDHYNVTDFRSMTEAERISFLKEQYIALIQELGEAMDEISWKPWASASFLRRKQFIGEIVDALHFVGNMLACVECTDEELEAIYLEKMERNRKRQLEGYTGLDKCFKCRRAADDLDAHGVMTVKLGNTMMCRACYVES